jgi:Transposase DDE domain group 1
MAKKRINQKSKKSNRKNKTNSAYASLCAISPVIKDKKVFDVIHQKVSIQQKTVEYKPTDKLVFVVLGIMSGCDVIFDLNRKLRIDRPLLKAFGYGKCADQSVIQDTLNAVTQENINEMEEALKTLWDENNLTIQILENAMSAGKVETIDMDLSGMPASKKAECSTKGYFSDQKNIHGRQLARILFSKTQEIISESLYPGNKTSCKTFKAMVGKMERILGLTEKSQRKLIRLRLDAGYGTDENIDYALWRGYQLLTKMYSGKRAKALSKSVEDWIDISPGTGGSARQAGWVTQPHRYCKKTKQLAIRALKDGKYQYCVIVATDVESDMQTIIDEYDSRSGAPESSFSQDNQGLGNRKRRKREFVAQQMLMLLTQLAHNLIRWIQKWMITAVEESLPDKDDTMSTESADKSSPEKAIKTLKEFGMKRFVRHILCLTGKVKMKEEKVISVVINPLYPLVKRIIIALKALLKPYGISVSLDEI